jgi:hypothetical protein
LGTAGGSAATAPPPAKRGIRQPAHASEIQKYGKIPNQGPVHRLLLSCLENNNFSRLNARYRTVCLDLVIASLAKNTWQRYDSAFRMWERFCTDCGIKADFNDFPTYKRNFILWCWENSNLAVSSIGTYLGVLKRVKQLADSLSKDEGDLERVLLKGMANLKIRKTSNRSDTVPVTPETLKLIRKGLSQWGERLSGQTIWTCCLVAFWGAFRLGELLGKTERKFDKFSYLLWKTWNWKGTRLQSI